jgi:hypothetical protein
MQYESVGGLRSRTGRVSAGAHVPSRGSSTVIGESAYPWALLQIASCLAAHGWGRPALRLLLRSWHVIPAGRRVWQIRPAGAKRWLSARGMRSGRLLTSMTRSPATVASLTAEPGVYDTSSTMILWPPQMLTAFARWVDALESQRAGRALRGAGLRGR